MSLLREHPDDLRALIGVTAQACGIDGIFIEKDFWVTEVLRAATSPVELQARDGSHHPVRTIFKGGTSLSRVYGLIERFSEDVDLLVDFPDVDASAGAKDRVLKAIRDAVTAHLGLGTGEAVTEGPSRPKTGFGDSPLLAADPPFRAALQDGYVVAMALVYGEQPSLDECLETIRARSALL